MNRFLFGKGWVYQDEADDNAGAGGGAAAGGEAGGEDDGADAGAADGADAGAVSGDGAAPASDKAKTEAPKDMLAAIDAGLGYKKGPNGEALDPLTGKPKGEPAGEKKDDKSPAGAVKETETQHANGKPKKDAQGQDLDANGKVVTKQTPKAKTSTELALSKEQLAALKPEARARFHEMSSTLKAHEGTIAKHTETIKTLSNARDAILGVMEETHTTQDQLSGYLEFNALLHSTNPKDLESALGMVEEQRTALYKALGREPQGGDLDLLVDFHDLKKLVDDEEMPRASALELAKGRRDKLARDAAAQREQNQQRQQTQSAEQKKQASESALTDISKWTTEISKTDLDYKAKEDKLLAEVDGVLKEYPAHLWLPTLKRLYAGIVIQKTPATSGKQNQPLRPSGAKPGAKAPASMLEAINQGLGYAGADKG